jgi:hypothetical protein
MINQSKKTGELDWLAAASLSMAALPVLILLYYIFVIMGINFKGVLAIGVSAFPSIVLGILSLLRNRIRPRMQRGNCLAYVGLLTGLVFLGGALVFHFFLWRLFF